MRQIALVDGFNPSEKYDFVSWDYKKIHQHRPQTATTHVSTKVMCNSKFMELSGTLLLRKERREKKGDKHRNPCQNEEESGDP